MSLSLFFSPLHLRASYGADDNTGSIDSTREQNVSSSVSPAQYSLSPPISLRYSASPIFKSVNSR